MTEGTRRPAASRAALDRRTQADPATPLPAARRLDLQPVSGVPIACALTGDEQAEQTGQWRDLLVGSRPEGIDGGLRWRLPVASAGRTAELAAAEQRCCGFYEFTLHLAAGELVFEARAPEAAADLFFELFGTRAGGGSASAAGSGG